jgi:hypothetical protein
MYQVITESGFKLGSTDLKLDPKANSPCSHLPETVIIQVCRLASNAEVLLDSTDMESRGTFSHLRGSTTI